MKKLNLLFIALLAIALSTVSCREEADSAEEKMEEVSEDVNDDDGTGDDGTLGDDDATDPVENTIQEGVNEVQENTGMGGEDDA